MSDESNQEKDSMSVEERQAMIETKKDEVEKVVNDNMSLFLALRYARNNHVEKLIQSGSDITEDDECKNHCLISAARSGNIEGSKLLLQKPEMPADTIAYGGRTALHHAVRFGHLAYVEYILNEAHASPDIADENGVTPLMLACADGNMQIIEVLHSFGANVNHESKAKCTPLMIASINSQLAVIDFLVKLGADPNKTDLNGQNALHHAAKCCLTQSVSKLLSQSCDSMTKDKNGMTPVQLASESVIRAQLTA